MLAYPATCQDIHFSQFNSSPLNLNPAQTGNFDGAYRFVGNLRRQWSSVTIPYQTFGFSADARNFLRLKNVGTGISLYNDNTGDSHFSTLQLNLAGAYTIPISKTQAIALGIQSGITQRRIDYSNLTYDEQYNGFIYDPTIPSTESFQNDGRVYANLNTGINWVYTKEERKQISSGISLFNLTRPPQSFFGNDQIRLDRRLSFNISSQWKLNDRFDLLPATLFMAQGTFRELIIGSSIKYIMEDNGAKTRNRKERNYRALYVGGWARTRDAGFISLGMDYDDWNFGLSYDINLSNLRPASHGRGGFELSVIYIIRDVLPKRLNYRACPDFM
jgi:type IX secretion system PorP/SprF family membrane protein